MNFTTAIEPGVCREPNDASSGFRLNHCMLRVKDPLRALDFYTRIMGMQLLNKLDFPEQKFSLFFLHLPQDGEVPPADSSERTVWTFAQRGVLELTHNWGTENDAAFEYHDGNTNPQGFGHICFSVPDLDAAVRWFEKNEVEFVKRPNQGKMKHVAFIKDADGYWLEIIEPARLADLGR